VKSFRPEPESLNGFAATKWLCRAARVAQLDQVLELAQYPNLALKWCHAPTLLSETAYPYRDVLPLLRSRAHHARKSPTRRRWPARQYERVFCDWRVGR
jgi:hypothetical protein